MKFDLSEFFSERALHFCGKRNFLDKPVCDGSGWGEHFCKLRQRRTCCLPVETGVSWVETGVGPRDGGRPPAPFSHLFGKIN